jgi:indoleamine 2,3-dioxygenase
MNIAPGGSAEFGVSPTTGFLPEHDPLDRLPSEFDAWENIAQDLPKYLMSDRFRSEIESLSPFPTEALGKARQWERAMVLLSYIGHGYVWCERPPDSIPAVLAVPWHAVATKLGRPPVLSYSSYCLHNWRRFDLHRPTEVGNIALIQNFLAGEDEEWFVLIHVDIEMRAAAAMSRIPRIQELMRGGENDKLPAELDVVADSIHAMNMTMDRMPERCDPYIYYQRVRPYIHGWRNHPDVPNGIVYEGVDEYEGTPQTFRGETGAQSAIVPALDALLGVGHAPDELRGYLEEMRAYMPPGHRRFIEQIERLGSVREVTALGGRDAVNAYNRCVEELETFRSTHLKYAAQYIFHQAQTDPKNPHAVGTGGTPFMPYLKKHRDETHHHLIEG